MREAGVDEVQGRRRRTSGRDLKYELVMFSFAIGISGAIGWLFAGNVMTKICIKPSDHAELKTLLATLEAKLEYGQRDVVLQLNDISVRVNSTQCPAGQLVLPPEARAHGPWQQNVTAIDSGIDQNYTSTESDDRPLAPRSAPSSSSPTALVSVTFRFEPPAERDAAKAVLFWLSPNGTEIQYIEIPPQMRVTERTRPGDCWVVRNKNTTRLLSHYCAASTPRQEVVVSGPDAALDNAPDATPSGLLDRPFCKKFTDTPACNAHSPPG